MRFSTRLCIVMLTVLALWALMVDDAMACTGRCVVVESETLEVCMECVDTGSYTGVTCWSKGPCTCYERLCPPPPGEASSTSVGLVDPISEECATPQKG